MKYVTLFAVLAWLVVSALPVLSQENEKDPFYGDYRLGDAAEVLLLWHTFGENQTYQKIYDYINLNNPDPNVPNQFAPSTRQSMQDNVDTFSFRPLDTIAGDFDGDDAEDVVAAWEGENRSIRLILPEIQRNSLDWSNANAMTVTNATLIEDDGQTGRQLRLVCGFFDSDPEEEFLLAYWAADSTVHLKLFDISSSLTPQEMSSLTSVTLPRDSRGMTDRSARFDVTAGDLDGDGTDEIILVAGQSIPVGSDGCSGSSGCWEIVMKVYDVDEVSGQMTEIALSEPETTLWQKTDNSSLWLDRIAVESGDFDDDGTDELVIGFEVAHNGSTHRWYLQSMKIRPDLSGVDTDKGERLTPDQTIGSHGFPLTIVTGDLDKDGDDEILYSARQLKIYDAPDSTFQLVQISGGGTGTMPGSKSRNMLVLADLDADNSVAVGDTSWSPEIVMVVNQDFSNDGGISVDGRFHLQVFQYIPGEFNLVERADLLDEVSDISGARPLALVAGNFGGKGVRAGRPRRFTKTDIVEPLVILNAPPTHFDVLDGVSYDVTQCYNENECNFVATYATKTENTIRTETVFNRDWSVGASVDGGFKIPLLDVGVKVHLETKYGRGFSRRDKNKERFTVSQETEAKADDWVYAVIVDYDVWEYPLYLNRELEGYIAVVVPKSSDKAWFDSKSFSAFTYIPSHEVGNILSYQEIAAPEENSAFDVGVRWETGDRVTLNNNSSSTWTITQKTETETAIEHSERKFIGGSVDFSVPFKFIPDFGIEGDYSESSVSNFTTSVVDKKGLSVHLDAIDLSFGNSRYSVTPYVYWAKNGALVLDYAVKPELPPNPLDPATWWSQNYGQKSDPAFILPWRYDPEKGLGLDDERQRERTRDIVFSNTEPEPGD